MNFKPMFAGLSALTLILLTGCKGEEIKHEAYPDRAAAKDAIDRGWLPEALPEAATGIGLSYDLDTNAVLARWKGPNAALPDCQPLSAAAAKEAMYSPFFNEIPEFKFESLIPTMVKCGEVYQSSIDDTTYFWSLYGRY